MLTAIDRRTQQDYISWRAPELARSGQFRDWCEIVRMLRYEGAYAAQVFMHPHRRATLNSICDQARTKIMADVVATLLTWVPVANTPTDEDWERAERCAFLTEALFSVNRLAPDRPDQDPWIRKGNEFIFGPKQIVALMAQAEGGKHDA